MPQIISFFISLFFFLMPAKVLGQEDVLDSVCVGQDSSYVFVRDTLDGFYFEKMDIDITIHENGVYDIVEDIDARFVEPRHGIKRDIPTRFWVKRDMSKTLNRSEYKMLYNRVDVEDIGVSDPFSQESYNELTQVKIGSPDEMVTGRKHYRISYRLKLYDDRVPESDLLFHSVVGTGWTCSTDSVRFTIHFDKEITQEQYERMEIFVGDLGSNDNRAGDVVDYADAKTIQGSIEDLPRYWGLTIYMPLPEGYFKADKELYHYLSWVAAGLTAICLLILLIMIVKGDKRVTSIISFSPPKGMTAADVGALAHGRIRDIELLSMIPWFASEGYISIAKLGDETVLRREKKLPNDAPDYQMSLYKAFFSTKKNSVRLSEYSPKFAEKWMKAKKQLEEKYEGKLNVSSKARIFMLLTAFMLSLTACWSSVSPDGMFYGIGIFVALLILCVAVAAWDYIDIDFSSIRSGAKTIFQVLIAFVATSIPMGLLIVFPLDDEYDFFIPKYLLLALSVAMQIVILFQQRLQRMTDYRRQHLGEIKGLKEFIKTAELHQLRAMLDQDERYFYRILPYAMVFGLVDEWARKFKDLPVKPVSEFANMSAMGISTIVAQRQWKSDVSAQTSKYSSRSSAGGSYSSARSSSGGYSGGGSGGGGGSSW